MSERLTPYRELAEIIDRLPLLTREARRARGLSLRMAADKIGISFNTVTRIEHGDDCSLSSAVAVLRWLDWTPERK